MGFCNVTLYFVRYVIKKLQKFIKDLKFSSEYLKLSRFLRAEFNSNITKNIEYCACVYVCLSVCVLNICREYFEEVTVYKTWHKYRYKYKYQLYAVKRVE